MSQHDSGRIVTLVAGLVRHLIRSDENIHGHSLAGGSVRGDGC
jgi:hypothetical protein